MLALNQVLSGEMINPVRESKGLPCVHIGFNHLSDLTNYTQMFSVISEERMTGLKGSSTVPFILIPILLLKFIQ